MVLVVVDLVQLCQVGVVEGLQDAHLVEQALCLLGVHVRFLDLLGRTHDTGVPAAHLIHTAEAAPAQLPSNVIVMQKTALFHLQKTHPTHTDLLDLGLALVCFLLRLLFAFRQVDVAIRERGMVEECSFGGRFREDRDGVSLNFG